MHQENDDESYYELFGLTRATFDENALKKAYKSLVKKYHPDHSEEPDASERFSEITQAYAVLSDPEKKRLYDTHGPDGVKMSGNTNSQQHPSGFPFDIFFNTGGGASFTQKSTPKGPTGVVEIPLSLEEIYSGTEKILNFARYSLCKTCSGSGAHSPSDISSCPKCQGSGIQIVTQVIGPFIQRIQTNCNECGGSGKKIIRPCAACRGSKVFLDNSPLHLHVPAGVVDGQVIILENSGDAGKDGAFLPGDIHCRIKELPHQVFRRSRKDPTILSMELRISLRESLLGWSMVVTGVSGNPLTISRDTLTPPNFVIEVPNGGLPNEGASFSSKKGPLFVSITVQYPKKLDPKETEIIKKNNLFYDSLKSSIIPVVERREHSAHDEL